MTNANFSIYRFIYIDTTYVTPFDFFKFYNKRIEHRKELILFTYNLSFQYFKLDNFQHIFAIFTTKKLLLLKIELNLLEIKE